MNIENFAGLREAKNSRLGMTLKGEHGLGHLTGGLGDLAFDTLAEAEDFVTLLCSEFGMPGRVELRWKKLPRNIHGTAHGDHIINLNPRFEIHLATVIHEFAHNLTHFRCGFVQAHGRDFKRSLRMICIKVYEMIGRDVPRTAHVRMPPVGALIETTCGRMFEVTATRRTKVAARGEDGKPYLVPIRMIKEIA